MAKKQSNYYKNSFDPSQRVLNIAQAMADKLGLQTPIDKTFSVAIPDEVQKGFRQQTANTSNPSRPRAQAIGYDFSKNTLYVVFRNSFSHLFRKWLYPRLFLKKIHHMPRLLASMLFDLS